MSVAISGAGGQLGRLASEYLLERLSPSDVILVTRDTGALADFAARGAQIRHGDFDQPDTLPSAFAGAERLLIISTADLGRRVPQHKNAVDAAVKAGVEHVAYTSVPNPTPENPAMVVGEHSATEQAIEDSGLAWTMLRMGLYSEFQIPGGANAVASGRLVHNAGDGRTAYISRADCAAAAGAWLATGGHEGVAFTVTGPELLSQADVAGLLSETTGRPVEAVPVSDEEFTAGLVAAGVPEAIAPGYATWGQAIRKGALNAQTTVVQDLTGRAPRSLRDVLTDHRDALLGS